MTIVDVGLVYGVTVTDDRLHVLLTMTSAACPVADVILEDVETELDRVAAVDMSDRRRAGLGARLDHRPHECRAKAFMGW